LSISCSEYLQNRFTIQRHDLLPPTLRLLSPDFPVEAAKTFMSQSRHLVGGALAPNELDAAWVPADDGDDEDDDDYIIPDEEEEEDEEDEDEDEDEEPEVPVDMERADDQRIEGQAPHREGYFAEEAREEPGEEPQRNRGRPAEEHEDFESEFITDDEEEPPLSRLPPGGGRRSS